MNTFVAAAPTVDPDVLYVIWAGAIDYLFAGQTDPTVPVNNLVTAVNTLSSAGTANFLLVNLPPLGEVPLLDIIGTSPVAIAGLNSLSAAHNPLLANAVTALNAPGNFSVTLLDVNSLLQSALAGELGFGKTTQACTLNPNCLADADLQDTYLFWDEVHPTTAAYRMVADATYAQVGPDATVPEPAATLGLILVAGWGFRQLKRRQTV